MDIFSLRCFLMLSELLNFTKTAQAMNISQPSLTRIIHGMENEIGVILFVRTKQGIILTEAGREFRNRIRTVVNDYDKALMMTKAIDLKVDGQIKIGFSSIMCNALMPSIISEIYKEYPDIDIDLTPLSQESLINQLNDGSIDLSLMLEWNLDRLNDCEHEIFFKDKYMLAMHKNHRLNKIDDIYFSDIGTEICLFYKDKGDLKTLTQDTRYSFYHSISSNVCANIRQISDFLGMLTLIESNLGIGVLPSHVERYCTENVIFRDFNSDIPEMAFSGVIGWSRKNTDFRIKRIRKIIKDVCLHA